MKITAKDEYSVLQFSELPLGGIRSAHKDDSRIIVPFAVSVQNTDIIKLTHWFKRRFRAL